MKMEELQAQKDLKIEPCLVDNTSVVYFLCDGVNEIVYIGRTTNFVHRVSEHKKRFPVSFVYYIKCSKKHSVKMERDFIKEIRPKYNIYLNPDNNKPRSPKLRILETHYGKNEVAEALGIGVRQYARIKTTGKSTETIRILVDELVNKIKFFNTG